MVRLRLLAPLGTMPHQMKRYHFLLAVLLLVSLLTACDSGAAASPASAPTKTVSISTPTPTQKVITSPIVGTYSTTISQKDVAAKPDLSPDLGTHTWIFKDNGAYSWMFHGPSSLNTSSFNVDGNYQVSQGALSMTDSVCANYFNAPGAGTYMWQSKGNSLILQVKSDACLDRKLVLTMHPLVKQGS